MNQVKKWLAASLAAVMITGLAGCTAKQGNTIPVVSVAVLNGMGDDTITDRYAGMVVAEDTVEVQRDENRTIKKLNVSVGSQVRQGEVLFTYDAERQQLELEKMKVELERLQTEIATAKKQIASLEAEKKKASKDDQLSYTVEINALEAQVKEMEYNLKLKKKELSKAQANVTNANVLSPTTGRVTEINEQGYDDYGNPKAYVVIRKDGNFRIKGTINELNRMDLPEGTGVIILSRTDSTQSWTGTVSLIDTDNPIQNSSNGGFFWGEGGGSELSSSSSYPFYVELDSSEGLLLGQHVYLTRNLGASIIGDGIWLPSYFVCFEAKDESTRAYVWAVGKDDKLEQRSVTLGIQDPATNSYEILEGLSLEDYIASPDSGCTSGNKANYDNPAEAMTGSQDQWGDAGMIDEFPQDGAVDGGFVDAVEPGEDAPSSQEIQKGDLMALPQPASDLEVGE